MTLPRLPRTPQELGLAADTQFFSAETAVNNAVVQHRSDKAGIRNPYRAIPMPQKEIAALFDVVLIMKENIETLLGTRGAFGDAAVKVGEVSAMLHALQQTEGARIEAVTDALTMEYFTITSADSPYTVTSTYATLWVDAALGNVDINLATSAEGVFCRVVRVDSSANVVDIASADTINVDASVEIYAEEIFDIYGRATGGYYL